MKTSTALSLLLAASPAVAIGAPGYAEEAAQTSDQIAELDGGYQEWTTDQDISDEALDVVVGGSVGGGAGRWDGSRARRRRASAGRAARPRAGTQPYLSYLASAQSAK